MYRTLLRSKIHRAVVTAADLNYQGSLTIDAALLEASNIREFELVQVVNINNGARLETYTIAGERGSGIIQLNGAAARLASIGDHIIIMSYALVNEPLPEDWSPTIVYVDDDNHVTEITHNGDSPCC
jgi:aspartate 1-decarboxylase